MKRSLMIFVVLLVAAGVWLFWPQHRRVVVKPFAAPLTAMMHAAATAPKTMLGANGSTNSGATKPNKFAYRLSNTTKTIGQLALDRHAILLENALIDTTVSPSLSIPKHLAATGDPGAFIVQAKGPIDAKFRAALAAAGAQIVSYIPNDAYLVRLSAASANGLAGNALVQAVLPYAPYYKVQSSLLDLAVNQKPLASGTFLTLGLFDDGAAATVQQIEKLGGKIVGEDRSPFGPIVRVQPPADWLALAQLTGVQLIEPAHRRMAANDLTRVILGVATNTVTGTNYLGLTGKNVLVEVNDSGIDATHPDFTTGGNPTTAGGAPIRVIGDSTNSLIDVDGHGTHVAGIIAGNGAKSYSVTNIPQGSVTNADFRGKAPLATLFSVGFLGANDFSVPDAYLQAAPAKTNALISNNSWVNGGAFEYDLSAASYDAAARDALPQRTGPQPVLFVFAAGNDGSGDDSGGGGTPDSVASPGTAKNVITVGALELPRGITNWVTALDGTSNQVWLPQTSSSSEVAYYSARGNVGIGTEGDFGRFKPDVVAPGSFVVSTRSSTWDQVAYYNPTNYYDNYLLGEVVDTNGLNYYNFPFVVKSNAVNVSLQIFNTSPTVTNLPIYVSLANYPDPATPSTYDFVTKKNNVTIPPDGGAGYLGSIVNNFGGFNFGIGSTNSFPVTYDLLAEMVTTNDLGDLYTVLSNLNNTIGPYYRYESGTSMAAPAVSGVLALMQDFFTNTLHITPSPVLLKAMLINGARPTGFYNFQVNNPINFEGWGLINLPNSIPSSLTNSTPSATNSFFFVDQSPTNTLATGDSRTYTISLSPSAQLLPLRITLAWTDPPGNPAAAIKLVNNLDLIVTNTDSSVATNLVVYYGNDIAANQVFNTPENATNSAGLADTINNVENIFLPANSGSNFTIVVLGAGVNVNAVTTQTNNLLGAYAPNISQDFALVISSGNGDNTNGFAITATTATVNPTGAQRLTAITNSAPSPLLNQFVGAASPLLGTNSVGFGTNSIYKTGSLVTAGMTNQWHFYVITNYGSSSDFTNAAFVTFLPPTASVPRGGTAQENVDSYTRPEADIDLYVSTDSSLTNLNPVVISNCVNGAQVNASIGSVFNGADLGRGGSAFVVDTNSAPGQYYYVGVKSEDQQASEYAFLSEFSQTPFSALDKNGNEYVSFYPVNIPDGDARHPGYTNTIGLAIYPIQVERVVVTNILVQQNPGDLVVALNHPTTSRGNSSVVLMNHSSPNAPGIYTEIYDDSGRGDILNAQPADGPGSLQAFARQQGVGIWVLHAADNAPGFVGGIGDTTNNSKLFIEKHQDLTKRPFITVSVAPGTWFYGFVDVPVGNTNLTVVATNLTPTVSVPPIELFVKYGSQPTFSDTNLMVLLTNCITGTYPTGFNPGNSISVGPPLAPGTYYVGIFNPDTVAHDVVVGAILSFNSSALTTVDFTSTDTPIPILDDALTTDFINVPTNALIEGFNVGIRVDHPRISDLAFTLIGPDGSRYLLMENRGGYTTSGAGATVVTTNITPVGSSGGPAANTNFVDVGRNVGPVTITWNFYAVPDTMDVYYQGALIFSSGLVSFTGSTNLAFGPGASTVLEIVMNRTNHPTRTFWTYTVGGVTTNISYLRFTEDTNLTTTPIKYAVPPFVPDTTSGVQWSDDFEAYTVGTYLAGASFGGGWTVLTNQVNIATNPPAYTGTNMLAIGNGAVSNTLVTIPGRKYVLQYALGSQPVEGLYAANLNDGTISSYNLPNTNAFGFAGGLNGPAALAFDSAGNLYEADSSTNKILKFTPGGSVSFFASTDNDPDGLTFDNSGNLYVANFMDNTIQKITPAGVVSLFASVNLDGPAGLAFDGTGTNLYVANLNGNSIYIFNAANPNGILFANDPGSPSGLAFDSTGTNLYVANYNGGSVEVFQTPSAITNTIIINLVNPTAVVFDNNDNLYVADSTDFNGLIYKYTAGVLTAFTRDGLNNPLGLAYYSNINPEATTSASWQLQSVAFTATQAGTPLVLDASRGGFAANTIISTNFSPFSLFDAFSLTLLPQDLYYQAEQSLDPIIGTSAAGDWEMEVLDSRTGAALNASLVSWQLEFIFANTNITPSALGTLLGGVSANNTIGAGGLGYYTVNVPPTANYATNLLLSASQPVNVWFSTNLPPTINGPSDFDLIPASTNGTSILSALTTPTLVAGTTYYLVIQNLTNTSVTFNVKVNFDVTNQFSSLHFSSAKVSAGKPQLSWTGARGVRYQVQWADQITSPMTWHTITNPATISTNGVSTFTDNGAQTAPLGPKRFYRLVKP